MLVLPVGGQASFYPVFRWDDPAAMQRLCSTSGQ
jgi:hypothetical protein